MPYRHNSKRVKDYNFQISFAVSFHLISRKILAVTTQSGSSGTTSQNDKGRTGMGKCAGGTRRDSSCARVAIPAPLRHSAVDVRVVRTRTSVRPRNTRVTFSRSQCVSSNFPVDDSCVAFTCAEERRRQGHRARHRSGSSSFVREARLAGQ